VKSPFNPFLSKLVFTDGPPATPAGSSQAEIE
jgi:hypothetical protein